MVDFIQVPFKRPQSIGGRAMADDRTEALDGEQLAHLARYFEEEVMLSRKYKTS
jgi:hypothetical protein